MRDDRVVLQAIFNLAFVDELVDAPREDEWALHESEYGRVRDGLFGYLRREARVAIDGIEVPPRLVEFDVDQGDPRFLPLFPTMGAKALIRARVVLEYSALRPPGRVGLVWPAYPPNTLLADAPPNVVQALFQAGADQRVVTLSDGEPEHIWHAPAEGTAVRLLPVPAAPPPPEPLRLPALSAAVVVLLLAATPALRRRRRALVALWIGGGAAALLGRGLMPVALPVPWQPGASLPDASAARAIFAPLHANIYRAFDYGEPEPIYDALARSVDGDLLDDLYAHVYRSLVMQEEGGAVSRVQAVRILDADVEHIGVRADGHTPMFRVRARWQVDGTVFHWGHRHFRTSEHNARYDVVAVADADGGWRIAGYQPLAQERVSARPDDGGSGR